MENCQYHIVNSFNIPGRIGCVITLDEELYFRIDSSKYLLRIGGVEYAFSIAHNPYLVSIVDEKASGANFTGETAEFVVKSAARS